MGRMTRLVHVASVLACTLFCLSGCSSQRNELLNSPLLPGSPASINDARGSMSEGKKMIQKGEQQTEHAADLREQAEDLRDEADQLDQRADDMIADAKRLKKRGKARVKEGEQELESVVMLEKAERMRRKGEALKTSAAER